MRNEVVELDCERKITGWVEGKWCTITMFGCVFFSNTFMAPTW